MTPDTRLKDRIEAGRLLAERLHVWAGPDTVVLALPRGGVPVGREIARRLGVPLDVIVVRKLGAPYQPELAVGAIASGGVRLLNEYLVDATQLSREAIEQIVATERRELERRERAYRGDREPLDLEGRVAIVVDDGAATGASMGVAIRAARRRGARPIVAAPPETLEQLREEADEVVCLRMPEPFRAVGLWYDDFREVSDQDVRTILDRDARDSSPAAASSREGERS